MKTGCVILADPHLGVLGGVHGLLASSFQTLIMVSDEHSLIEATERINPSLLVVDLTLPKSGEPNIVKRLHGAYPEIPLVILSVHDEPSVATEVRAAGAAGFVIKRNIGRELLSVINRIRKDQAFVPVESVGKPLSGNQRLRD